MAEPRTSPARRWSAVPLRARLVGILLVLLIAALTVTGWSTQHVMRGYLTGKVDDQLRDNARGVVQYAGRSAGRWGGPDWRGLPTDYALQLSYDDGAEPQLILPPFGRESDDVQPDLPVLTSTEAERRDNRPFTVGSEVGDLEWRVVVLKAEYTQAGLPDRSGSVAVALPLDGVDDAVTRVRWLAVLFGLVVALGCALLGWLAIRRAFLPLTEVERTAAAIAAGDLSRRIPEYPASTEVGRLTSSLNGMLAQIEAAFRAREASEGRTRRFAADASHELRTPLAAIRGYAELYRQGAVREPDDVRTAMGRIEAESRRMGSLVEDLLLLARLDEQRPGRSDPVDLAVLAGDAVHDARVLAPGREVRLVGLAGGGPVPAMVTGDENRLRQVVANLVANAVRHTPEGRPIEVAVGTADPDASRLEVRDHGEGIPPEHASRVFERFYRLDFSRSRGHGGGSGLGLSIVAAVVASHGGSVDVVRTPGGGATFRVTLPGAPRADDPDAESEADQRAPTSREHTAAGPPRQ